MRAAAPPAPSAQVAPGNINPWIIALAVVVPAFMEVLGTTIANVSLRYLPVASPPRRPTASTSSLAICQPMPSCSRSAAGWLPISTPQVFSAFDTIGFSLLVFAVVYWEVVLSTDQEWDWVWRSLWSRADIRLAHGPLRRSPILWESRQASPIVNFRPLLYATSTLLPGLLQSLFGYDAYRAGLVMSPAGIFSIMAIIGGGALIGL